MPVPSDHIQQIAQAMSIKYNNRVYEMRGGGVDVIVLSLGEAFFDIPLLPFDPLPYPALYHYSHSRGIPQLRSKLAAYYESHYGVRVNSESEILITAGSKIAIHMAFMAVVNPGDEVLIQEPAWVSYPEQVKLCHGVPVMIPHWEPIANLERHITDRTKAIVVNTPHNPRGMIMSRDEILFLYSLARKHDLYIMSDEAYSDFVLAADDFVSCGTCDPDKANTIVFNSMSKNYGMSGWRVGYLITNADLTNEILKINQHLVTCPATILEYYLAEYFDDILAITMPQIHSVLEQRRKVASYMDSLSLSYLPGAATFYFFVSIAESSLSSEQFCDVLLDRDHISVVPGVGYGHSCDKFIRVSVGTESMDRVQYGLRKVKDLIIETSPSTRCAALATDLGTGAHISRIGNVYPLANQG